MKRTLHREKAGRFCDLEISLENGRLSICGSEGRIVKSAAAKREAFQYWKSFFEESREGLGRMAIEYGKRTPASAARFVLQSDGDYHGLDVHGSTASGSLMIVESSGQITDTLLEWFPECEPYLKWHLNDMKAGTPAQEAELARHDWGRHGSYYDWACARLSDASLLTDNGYKYGSAWLKVELPPEVVKWAQEVTA